MTLLPIGRSGDLIFAGALDGGYSWGIYLYTRDIGRAWRVMEALEYGLVAVNEGRLSSEVARFGGVNQSGFGREGSSHGLLLAFDVVKPQASPFNRRPLRRDSAGSAPPGRSLSASFWIYDGADGELRHQSLHPWEPGEDVAMHMLKALIGANGQFHEIV